MASDEAAAESTDGVVLYGAGSFPTVAALEEMLDSHGIDVGSWAGGTTKTCAPTRPNARGYCS